MLQFSANLYNHNTLIVHATGDNAVKRSLSQEIRTKKLERFSNISLIIKVGEARIIPKECTT
jgi:hypothetical protein